MNLNLRFKMEKIVCDTMIWYKLGNGSLRINELGKVHLIFTGCSMWELATSERMLTNSTHFKDACIAVAKYASEKNLKLPYDQMLDIQATNGKLIDAYSELEWIASNADSFNPLANEGSVIKAREAMQKEKTAFEPLVSYLNEKAKEISERLRKNKRIRDKHKTIDNIIMCKRMIQQECNMWARLASVSEKEVNFNNHKLFITVLDKWYKNFELGSEVKMKVNDWFDVYNMVYVSPGMKYWTYEKKWILTIWDSGMKDYLFIDEEVSRILKKYNRTPSD